MSKEAAHRRIAAIHGHIVEGRVRHAILHAEVERNCAATGTLRYARPSAFEDLKHARVGAPTAYEVHREKTALLYAERVLWALQKGPDRFASIPEPPAYARPALGDSKAPAAAQQRAPAKPKPAARRTLKPELARAFSGVSQRPSEPFSSPRLTAGWTPKVDAVETPSHYQLEVALPGVRKEDLRVELWGPFLTVSGTRAGAGRSAAAAAYSGGAQPGRAVVRRREMDHGFFSATWKLPASGNLDSLYAESVDGVLRVYLRKRRAGRGV